MNPILSQEFKIPFAKITADDIETAIPEILDSTNLKIKEIVKNPEIASYQNTIVALEDRLEPIDRAVTIVYHLKSVKNTASIREAFNSVLESISKFYAELALNQELWQRLKEFADSPAAQDLKGIEKRHFEKTIKSFVRNGADLDDQARAKIKAIKIELSELQNKFSENVLDSSNQFELILTSPEELSGLPQSVLQMAKEDAENKQISGYRFSLQAPYIVPFLKYSNNRALRKKMHNAYENRASSGKHDNENLIDRILLLRQELALILGYKNFSEYQLEERMLNSTKKVKDFQAEVYQKTLPFWQKELDILKTFSKEELHIKDLKPWDISYAIEKLKLSQFSFDDEELRPYFSLKNALAGLFEIVNRLFAITIKEEENEEKWHEDVRYYNIFAEDGSFLGAFYTDLFPREEKRSGAWMNSFITGGPKENASFSPHLGLIVANFNKAQKDTPSLLSHRELETLFHEFGHLLHHMLSNVEIKSLSGTNVAWDFVELPSQLMENWTYEKQALDLFAKHYKTSEALPDDLLNKLLSQKQFMQAHYQMRQLSFGDIDLALHSNYSKEADGTVVSFSSNIMENYAIKPEFAHSNFIKAFSHIFSGGYASGYYSYKWSEVLEADAFTRFKNEGVFNSETGKEFKEKILSKGNSEEANKLFEDFMNRKPSIQSLLDRNLGALSS